MGHSHILVFRNGLIPNLTVTQEAPPVAFSEKFCLRVARRQTLRIRSLTGPASRNLKVGGFETHAKQAICQCTVKNDIRTLRFKAQVAAS